MFIYCYEAGVTRYGLIEECPISELDLQTHWQLSRVDRVSPSTPPKKFYFTRVSNIHDPQGNICGLFIPVSEVVASYLM